MDCSARVRSLAQEIQTMGIRNEHLLAAQWILQNPDKNIADYTFVFRRTYEDGCYEFSIEARGKY